MASQENLVNATPWVCAAPRPPCVARWRGASGQAGKRGGAVARRQAAQRELGELGNWNLHQDLQ